MSVRVIFGLLKETFNEWLQDKAPRLGAALAYYSVFSIAPLVIIAIAAAALIFGDKAAQGQIVQEIGGTVGEPVARSIEELVKNNQNPTSGTWATVIGIATLLLGASGVFGQLQDALNTVWKVAPKPGRGLWGMIQDRFLSLTMVLGTGFMLLISLIITAVLEALTKWWTPASMPGGTYLWQGINWLVSFGVVALLFAMIFKYLPDARIAWRDVWIGAAITAFLFGIGKYLIGVYLGQASPASAYGAAGSLVVLLLWVYYSSLILLFGAEFTCVYAKHFGHGIQPSTHAVLLNNEQMIEEGIARDEDVERLAQRSERGGRKFPGSAWRREQPVPAGAHSTTAQITAPAPVAVRQTITALCWLSAIVHTARQLFAKKPR